MEHELPSLEEILGRIWSRLNILDKGTTDFDDVGNSPQEIITHIESNVSYYPASDVIARLAGLQTYIDGIFESHVKGWVVPENDAMPPDMWTDDEITARSKDELLFYRNEIYRIRDFVSAQGCVMPAAVLDPQPKQSKRPATGLKLLAKLDEEIRLKRIFDFVDDLVGHEFIKGGHRIRTEQFFKGQQPDEKIKWLKGQSTLRELIVLLTKKNKDGQPFARLHGKWEAVANCFTDNGSDFTADQIRGSNKPVKELKELLLRSLKNL